MTTRDEWIAALRRAQRGDTTPLPPEIAADMEADALRMDDHVEQTEPGWA